MIANALELADRRTASALDGLGSDLIALVSDLTALGRLAEQSIWDLEERSLGPGRAVLDGIADLAREAAESVAERTIALGHHPEGREAVAKRHILEELGSGSVGDGNAITMFEGILETVTAELHHALTDANGDPVTQDLLTGIAAELEKRAWIVRGRAALGYAAPAFCFQ